MEKYSKKLVAVLNDKIPIGKVMNVLAHMAVGLGASIKNKDELKLVDYVDADNISHTNISELPFIILKAKNPSQIRNLREELVKKGIYFIDFPDFINSIGTFDEHNKSKQYKESSIEYYGIAIFGNWDDVTNLTKGFSLWK